VDSVPQVSAGGHEVGWSVEWRLGPRHASALPTGTTVKVTARTQRGNRTL